MLKKLTLLALAVGALVAFAAPSVASAHKLTTNGGGLVPVNTTINGKSTDTVTTLPNKRHLTCAEVEIHGTVEVNDGETVRVGMDGVSDTATGCHLVVTNPESSGAETTNPANIIATVPLTYTLTFEELHLETGGTSTLKFSFMTHIPVSAETTITCQANSGASAVEPTTGTDSLHIEVEVGVTGAGCPSESTLHGTLHLSDAMGAIEIS